MDGRYASELLGGLAECYVLFVRKHNIDQFILPVPAAKEYCQSADTHNKILNKTQLTQGILQWPAVNKTWLSVNTMLVQPNHSSHINIALIQWE
jgi:hypothetical protein